jgi:flagellar biosynthesis regulator FlaF
MTKATALDYRNKAADYRKQAEDYAKQQQEKLTAGHKREAALFPQYIAAMEAAAAKHDAIADRMEGNK